MAESGWSLLLAEVSYNPRSEAGKTAGVLSRMEVLWMLLAKVWDAVEDPIMEPVQETLKAQAEEELDD